MKPLKSRLSLTVDDDILEQLRVLAEEDDRSLSQYINRVLRAHVSNRTSKRAEGRRGQRSEQ